MLKTDEVAELERQQLAKLLSLERRELQHQKGISDTWVRYIYTLLETTTAHCAAEKVSFEELPAAQQSLLLRAKANELRARFQLPSYAAIYDPLDASEIVRRLASDALGAELGMASSTEEVAERLHSKFAHLLATVPVRCVCHNKPCLRIKFRFKN